LNVGRSANLCAAWNASSSFLLALTYNGR
jgi:hypothetical protein